MRPPFFAFYPSDFADDVHVAAMSTLQVGAYLLLLCKAWQGEPPASLPNDDLILARFARVDAVVWAEIKAGVLVPFHVSADGRLHSKRLRREYDAALKRMRTAKESGRKGGKAAQGAVKAARAANSQGCLERPSEGGSSGGRALETGDWRLENKDKDDRPPDPPLPAATPPPAVGRSEPDVLPFDPLRAEQAARKEFEARWKAAGLRKFSRLSPSLQGRLLALLGDPWWAANYPAALARAGAIPFLASGLDRRNGAMDVSEFLGDPDVARKILDGVYDPRPAPAGRAGPAAPPPAADPVRAFMDKHAGKPAPGEAA